MDDLDYNEEFPGESRGEVDVGELLEESQKDKKQRLESELERIDEQLEQRERIHEEAVDELESKLDWYLERLKTLYKQHRGKQGRRDEVKSRIKEFYRGIREEKRGRWRDRQELEMERREVLRELEEMGDRNLGELL